VAYTLKSTGLAADLLAVYMVDDDGVTLREWVSGQFSTWNGVDAWADDTGNADMSVDAPVQAGTAQWKGASRTYFEVLANGGYGFYGIRHSAAQSVPGGSSGGGFGVFAAAAGMGASGGNIGAIIGYAASGGSFGVDVGPDVLSWWTSSADERYASTQALPSDGSTAFSVGGNYHWDTNAQTFYGLESGALAATDTAASPGQFAFASYDQIGGNGGQGSLPAKYHVVAIFNRELTETEYQTLHNDYLGTLFDVPATDTTPPTFTSGPASANLAQTAFDVQATMDETGAMYAVALASGATAPTSAEVKAGTGSGGAAAVATGSTAATAATQATISLTGFTAGTAYDVYVVGEDAVPNLQASPTLVSVTTLATPHAVFSIAGNNQLVDASGAPINLTGLDWAFAEQKSPVSANVSDEGTGLAITNGEVDIVLSNTTLAVGAQGALTLYDPATDVTRRYIVTLTG